jgi:hypothetical protein
MPLPRYIIFLFFLTSLTAFSQPKDSAAGFKKFLSHFEKVSLPLCEDYSEYERAYDTVEVYLSMTVEDTVEIAEEDDTIVDYRVSESVVIAKDSSTSLRSEYYLRNVKPALDTAIYNYGDTFFYLAFPMSRMEAKNFTALTIDVQYYNGWPGSIIYLAIFTRTGRLVGMIKIASLEYAGSYTDDYGGRAPWFPVERGCMEKDWKVKTYDVNDQLKAIYQINEDGKIVLLGMEE